MEYRSVYIILYSAFIHAIHVYKFTFITYNNCNTAPKPIVCRIIMQNTLEHDRMSCQTMKLFRLTTFPCPSSTIAASSNVKLSVFLLSTLALIIIAFHNAFAVKTIFCRRHLRVWGSCRNVRILKHFLPVLWHIKCWDCSNSKSVSECTSIDCALSFRRVLSWRETTFARTFVVCLC